MKSRRRRLHGNIWGEGGGRMLWVLQIAHISVVWGDYLWISHQSALNWMILKTLSSNCFHVCYHAVSCVPLKKAEWAFLPPSCNKATEFQWFVQGRAGAWSQYLNLQLLFPGIGWYARGNKHWPLHLSAVLNCGEQSSWARCVQLSDGLQGW